MKPRIASGYSARDLELVQALYLTVARVLGAYIEDLTVIGGLVPRLLVPQDELEPLHRHVGTADLDLVFEVTLLDEARYKEVAELLRGSGFTPGVKPDTGARKLQQWVAPGTDGKAVVEFLIPPTEEGARPGSIKNLEGDFGAMILPAGRLAFEDRVEVEVRGRNLQGAKDRRTMWVCGPGAFLVLKALAHRHRDEPKDAYDIDYLVARYPGSPESIAERFRALPDPAHTAAALEILAEAFEDLDSTGPVDVAHFLEESDNEDLRQDVSARLSTLVALLR